MQMKQAIQISGAIVAGLILLSPPASHAQDARQEIEDIVRDYLATHPDDVGQIVKDYLVKHPEAVGEIMVSVLKRRPSASNNAASGYAAPGVSDKAADRGAAVTSNAAALFFSSHQVTLGNPDGDVTLVEFFDYSCGFCKRALPDMLSLIKDDPKLKVVLKELPILGPGSAAAARVAVAVRMQSPDGQKYLAFHRELLGSAGAASKEKALTAAQDQGLDLTKLEQDVGSDEVAATIGEDAKLASVLGITGTPSYVVGDKLIVGAVGIAALKEGIEAARRHGVN
jgi:protein-disulfide isomerase